MHRMTYKMKSKVWLYAGPTAWHFITVPKELSEIIKEKHAKKARGFGSLRVRVSVGNTSWDTSIFPDSRSGTYLLPLKAGVRKKEEIFEGDTIALTLDIKS